MRSTAIGLTALLLAGCGGGTSTEPPPDPAPPAVTTVTVVTVTSGAPTDPDGYVLIVDDTIQKHIAGDDSISFDLTRDAERVQTLVLTDVEPNCIVQPTNERILDIGQVLRETFSVVCSGLDSLANKILFDHRGSWRERGIYMMGPDGSEPTKLVDGVYPAVSPDGRKFAFCEYGSFIPENVFVANADGGGRKQISRMAFCLSRPAWSPDGKKIAFARQSFGLPPGLIYVVNASGIGGLDSLGSGTNPDWSPDGLQIAHTGWTQVGPRQFESDVWVMDANGANKRNLTKNPDSTEPAWSPDGSRIAFVRGSDIYVMNSDGSNPVNITNTPNAVESNPAWSRNSMRIAFARGQDIWVMDADGSARANLTQSPNNADLVPSWSP